MNFQDKVFESTADFRARAAALTRTAFVTARARATQAAGRVSQFRSSLTALQIAGREFNKVASRHFTQFLKQNSSLARDVGKDVSALARDTYQQLAMKREIEKPRKARKPPMRKRAAAKAG